MKPNIEEIDAELLELENLARVVHDWQTYLTRRTRTLIKDRQKLLGEYQSELSRPVIYSRFAPIDDVVRFKRKKRKFTTLEIAQICHDSRAKSKQTLAIEYGVSPPIIKKIVDEHCKKVTK